MLLLGDSIATEDGERILLLVSDSDESLPRPYFVRNTAPAPRSPASANGSADALLQFAEPLMDEEEERVPPDVTLQLSDHSATGYRGVHKVRGRYAASCSVQGRQVSLGTFDTAVQAAVAYARHAASIEVPSPSQKSELPPNYEPPGASILQAVRDRDEALADMTAEAALRVADEEGIELETSNISATGYVGVYLNQPGTRRPFQLQMWDRGLQQDQCVARFSSAEAAALCKARIERQPDGLTQLLVGQVIGKLVEATARAVEQEEAAELRRQKRERETAAREADAAAAEAKKAEAIVTRCLHREIRLLAEELSLSEHTLQLALERSDVLVEVHALHTECAACRSKWAGITRAINKQPNAQAWTLGLHALRVAGVCIVYAQREAPEHAHDVASKRFQRMAEAASAVMAAEGRPKDSTRKSDLPLEALWLIDRGMERREGREITFRCGAVAAPQ